MNAIAAQPKQKPDKTAINPTRAENFPEWYQEVVRAADMAENAPVRGCMTIKPYGYAVWENIQSVLGKMIKDTGAQNAYFPLLIPLSYISKEAEHVDGFAKECAVVTHHRLEKNAEGQMVPAGELTEPFVIRPTSETIIGEAMSRWVHSYRDLPLKLNQWCNVMRWEMRPRVFLRTTEFLWQEGHNCFSSPEEAREDSLRMLSVYADFIENTLAIHVNKGEKTPDERFPGAIATYTCETMMQDGKSLQSCTSHDLGQTFSRGANIQFQGQDGQQHFAHTTSWGLSTRIIGGLIMVHGDDDGMVMPPRIAPFPVEIIPFYKDNEQKQAIDTFCRSLQSELQKNWLPTLFNNSDDRASEKTWTSIKKGVPIRLEVGQKEMEGSYVTLSRRDLGRQEKKEQPIKDLFKVVKEQLDEMHYSLLSRSKKFNDEHIVETSDLNEIRDFFGNDKIGFVLMDSSLLSNPDFMKIRKDFAVTPRCLPFEYKGNKVLVGKSY